MKRAFTMLELIVVIVVIGILAAIAIPRIQRNSLIECADQIVNDIRYTQHLAIDYNEYNRTDPNWFKKNWRIMFHNTEPQGGWSYTIFRDSAGDATGNPNSIDEIALSPSSSTKLLSAGYENLQIPNDKKGVLSFSPKLAIEKRYGVKDVQITWPSNRNTNSQTISFDQFGAPMGQLSNSAIPYDKLAVQGASATNPATANAAITSDGRVIRINICDTEDCSGGKNVAIDVWVKTGFAEVNRDPKISTAFADDE